MLNVVKLVYAAVSLVVLLVEDLMDGQPGIQKKAEAITRIKDVVVAALGFWPAWIPDGLLGTAIDWVVSLFNRDGTFRKSENPAKPAPAAGNAGERVG